MLAFEVLHLAALCEQRIYIITLIVLPSTSSRDSVAFLVLKGKLVCSLVRPAFFCLLCAPPKMDLCSCVYSCLTNNCPTTWVHHFMPHVCIRALCVLTKLAKIRFWARSQIHAIWFVTSHRDLRRGMHLFLVFAYVCRLDTLWEISMKTSTAPSTP